MQVNNFKFAPDVFENGVLRVPGSIHISVRFLAKGYPFVLPSLKAGLTLDPQDGFPLAFSGFEQFPALEDVPTTILGRSAACKSAFGVVLSEAELEGELLGWYRKLGSERAKLAWVFHAKKHSIVVDARSGSVIDRLAAK